MDTQTSSMRSAHRGPDLPRGLTGRREELMLPRPEHGRAAGAGSQLEVVRTTGDQERRPADERALALTWTHEGEEQRCVLGQGVLTIGAHGSNSIQLADRCVSRFHARVHRRTDGQLWLRDLGSRNGTFVDGLRVTESALACGARLRVGGTELRLEPAEAPSMHGVRGFDARDPALASALALLRRAAPSRVPVLLFGESGTGKEVAARALHELSPRAQGPLVPVNCGAIAAELAESELFGHERGAFTGAVTSSMGAFGAAEGGTLFLDEIGELPLALQAKLLRALEADEVKAVGAPRPRRVDVRIVCASHRDLREMVSAGTFREDLYWRLRGVIIHIAPLRERPGDILPIAERFLAECTPGEFVSFSPDAREALQGHGWPGNVRELKQVVRLAVLLREGPQIRRRDLALDAADRRGTERAEGGALCCAEIEAPFPQPAADPDARGLRGATGTTDPMFQLDLSRPLKLADVEEAAIRASHQRNRGVHRMMAVELGIARSSLLRKLDAFGMR